MLDRRVTFYVQLRLSPFGIIGCPNRSGPIDKSFPIEEHTKNVVPIEMMMMTIKCIAHILLIPRYRVLFVFIYRLLLFDVRQIRCVRVRLYCAMATHIDIYL